MRKTTDKLFELFTSRLELDVIPVLQTSSMTICYSSIWTKNVALIENPIATFRDAIDFAYIL